MDDRPVLITKRRSGTKVTCLNSPRMVRASTRIAYDRDPNVFRLRNGTGHGGHPAKAPATGSFQA
jgi:hypothetical protein